MSNFICLVFKFVLKNVVKRCYMDRNIGHHYNWNDESVFPGVYFLFMGASPHDCDDPKKDYNFDGDLSFYSPVIKVNSFFFIELVKVHRVLLRDHPCTVAICLDKWEHDIHNLIVQNPLIQALFLHEISFRLSKCRLKWIILI
jgi:hypothetical protein